MGEHEFNSGGLCEMSALCAAFDVVTREQRVFEWILKTNLVRNPSTNEYLMNISRHNCCELN